MSCFQSSYCLTFPHCLLSVSHTLIGHKQWSDLEVAEGAVVRIVYQRSDSDYLAPHVCLAVLLSRKRHYVAPLPDKNRSGCEYAVSTQTIIIAP